MRMIAFWLFSVDTGAERTLICPCSARASMTALNFPPATPIWNAVVPAGSAWRAVAPPVSDPDRESDERSGKADQLIPYFVSSLSVTSRIFVSIITPLRILDSRTFR
jgi:hypothetical protein